MSFDGSGQKPAYDAANNFTPAWLIENSGRNCGTSVVSRNIRVTIVEHIPTATVLHAQNGMILADSPITYQ